MVVMAEGSVFGGSELGGSDRDKRRVVTRQTSARSCSSDMVFCVTLCRPKSAIRVPCSLTCSRYRLSSRASSSSRSRRCLRAQVTLARYSAMQDPRSVHLCGSYQNPRSVLIADEVC